ncbi:ABC transporter permease [Pollutibacter soli]|uniref:ABC transporter permease n=1 Tax=Pollutibacter soli TaxID=3034157 RepID=UPI0030133B69
MNTSLFIAKRIALNREKSFSRFIIRLAITATLISVAAMILSLAFINGFQKVVSEKVFSFWGHIRVQHFEPLKVSIAEESPINKNDTIEQEIAAMNNVAFVQRFATKSAILNANGSIEGVLFKGIDSGYHFEELDQFLTHGRWMQFSDTSYATEIVISEYIANRLGLKTNDELLIYFIQPGEEKPRTRKLKITGLFKTGIDVYDKTFALGDLRLIQRLNNWSSDQIGGYEVRLKDYTRMAENSNEIYEILPIGWNSRTMMEIYPEIFDWLNLQNTNKYILLAVMITVALINLITCLIILVLERTRMIGVLKAVGFTDWNVQRIFMFYGSLITIAGVIGGLILGLGISFLQKKTGFIKLDEEAYYMREAPIELIWWQIAAVVVGTFFVCFLVLLIPSLISRKISPAKAVQFR